MKVIFFDTHRYEREAFEEVNRDFGHDILFVEPRLTDETANLAQGFTAVCSFVNDHLDRNALCKLKRAGIKIVALRSAGFNHVDLAAATEFDLAVVRVPEYSPYAIAEHVVALVLTLNRKIHRAVSRTRELNFSLEGLVGFDLHGKAVGIIGTGRIGRVAAKIFSGFGCQVLASDIEPDTQLVKEGLVHYVELPELLERSDIVTLHVPLNPSTHHMLNDKAFNKMKPGAILINTGRGALIDTRALIDALKLGQLGGAGLDVYEEEEGIFFHDFSDKGISDDVLARLLTFPSVVVTSHQAFLTHEALRNIAQTTLASLGDFENGRSLNNLVEPVRSLIPTQNARTEKK